MADRDAYLTDPGVPRRPGRPAPRPARTAPELAARIDPRRAAAPPAADQPAPAAGRSTSPSSTREGNAVSLIESNYMGFGSGVVDPATGIHYQNRGSYFSLDPDHPNVLAPGKRTLHTLLPGMLFRDRRRPRARGSWPGSMGGDAQPQIHAQFGRAPSSTAASTSGPRSPPRAGSSSRPTTSRRRSRSASSRATRRGSPRRSTALGHPVATERRSTRDLGHEHAIELVDGGPAAAGRLAGRRDRPAQRGAAGRLVRPWAVTPVRYSGRRWQAALTRRRHRSSSSSAGQRRSP